MNILYINHYAGSPDMGMEFRPYYLSREWIKMGHNVTIVAGDYSHLRRVNPTVTCDFQTEVIDGIEYVWLQTGEYQGNGVKRAFTMEKFVRKLFCNAKKIASKWKPDIVIASSTYPLDAYAAKKIAKYAKAKYVHEVHDMWPATLYEIGGMSKKNPFVVVMQLAENYAYKHCDKCIALAPYSKDYMVEHGLNPNKFVNIQNGVVEDEWEKTQSLPEVHKRFFDENKDKFIIGYFGGHALSNALDNVLNIAKSFLNTDKKDIIFVFVGEGVEKDRLVKRVEKENISNAFFLPAVSKRQVPSLLKHFDCSYMTGLPSPLYRFGLCLNKMYDSMMAGLPIMCAFDAPDTLVRQYNCGYQCSPSNQDEVVADILKIYSMTDDERSEMGKKGKEAILNNFTYKKLAERFLASI